MKTNRWIKIHLTNGDRPKFLQDSICQWEHTPSGVIVSSHLETWFFPYTNIISTQEFITDAP